MNFFKNIFLLLIFYSFISCNESLQEKGSQSYIDQIRSFHQRRINGLKENGWLNLAGLFWLHEGTNSFGSDKSCEIIFPNGKCPPIIGTFDLRDSIVKVNIEEGIEVTSNNKKVTEMIMVNDSHENPTVLSFGTLRWLVIRRGDKYGIRLRDLESPLVKKFEGIENFPINSDWKFAAKFEKYKPAKKIEVPNILGQIDEEESPGALLFNNGNQTYKLDVITEGDSYFIIFADETSGKETYGGGRFLYTDKADSTGNVLFDFNKAYNPPCVFTKFATCPLPPKQNYLKLRITAGEKVYSHDN